jgi:replicative DNA helicase
VIREIGRDPETERAEVLDFEEAQEPALPPHSAQAEEAVLEHAIRRRYISAAQQVAELAWGRRKDLDEVKHLAEAAILGASSETMSRRAVLAPIEWTAHLLEYLDQARTDGLAGVSTGLRDLDTITLGLSPGLYLLAASTGTGKDRPGRADRAARGRAAWLGGVREHGADGCRSGRSARVGHHQHHERAARDGRPGKRSQQLVLSAIERLSRSKLHLVYGSGYTSSDVRAYALQVQAAEAARPALVVVDYVQLLRDEEGDGRIRERNVSAAVRGLKSLSAELELPVLALVQLNRNCATRADKRPQLADLRESGELENTADSVLGLYRDEIDHPDTKDRGLAELSVLKKRQLGEEVGTMRRLVWVGESYKDFAYNTPAQEATP